MKLHTVFITYNRLELTKRAIESYLETVSVPFTFIVYDNASTDGTQEWLMDEFPFGAWGRNEDGSQHAYVHTSTKNNYPGAACNDGWDMLECTRYGDEVRDHGWKATHLHRADNDFIFLPGWCDQVKRGFVSSEVGQLGLRTNKEELNAPWNVGGNCVIRRELWDKGLRWDERPWTELGGTTEDYYMSQAVTAMGYQWKRVKKPCIQPISVESRDDPYYSETWGVRGI